jgi:hypothetical protein
LTTWNREIENGVLIRAGITDSSITAGGRSRRSANINSGFLSSRAFWSF